VARTMQVPILKQGQILIASVQSALTDDDLLELRDNLVGKAGTYQARGVIIDVTTLDIIDSFACRLIRNLTISLRLRGAEAVIVGIQPDVAFAMVQLGLSLDGVTTMLDLEDALDFLHAQNPG